MPTVQRIFVGDVQGCGAELDEMLERAAERFGTEPGVGYELWLVGDLVNRGPRNHAVLVRVREERDAGRARCVLGNHELAFLASALGLREPGPSDSLEELLERPDCDEWVDWVRRLPLVETGRLGKRRFAMVHASVHPEWSLAELERRARRVERRLKEGDVAALRTFLGADPAQDEDRNVLGRLTSCRSVGPKGSWSKQEPRGEARAWHRAWSKRGHDYGVVYGHWAMQGLHVAPGLRGLDTGCVHHGRDHDGNLTAWLPDERRADPFALPDEGFWQVRARERYYRTTGTTKSRS